MAKVVNRAAAARDGRGQTSCLANPRGIYCRKGGCQPFVSVRAVKPVAPLSGKVRAHVRLLGRNHKITKSGSVILELKLMNVSNADTIVYNELEQGWLVVIEVLGDNGVYKRAPMMDELRKGRGGKYHYACLPPGGFAGRQYLIRPSDPWWGLEPAKYKIRVVYRNSYEPCVASPCFTDKDLDVLKDKAVVPLLTGMIASNVAEFEVVKE